MRPFAGAIALAALVAGCAAPAPIPAHDRADLEAQALRSLQIGYALLIDPAADTRSLVGDSGEFCRDVSADDRRAEIARRRTGNAAYGVRYVEARVRLTGESVRASGSSLILRANERTDLVFDTPTRTGDVTGLGRPHDFIYELRDGRWTLVFDRAAGMGCGLPTI